MLEKGIQLSGPDENLAQNLSDMMSPSMWIFFDYIDSLQIRQDTAIYNEFTLRQLDQILTDNLQNINLLDVEEDMTEEFDLDKDL